MNTNEVAAAATTNPRVLVMMATYNGEKYVAEQIDSILAQGGGVDVTLVIRDDGSTDGTAAICEQYARNHSNIDFAVNEQNKGCALNFMDMVYAADATTYDYFAFSDQDDYWLPEKLSKAIEQLNSTPATAPALYYSDVLNVDAELNGECPEYYPFAQCHSPLKAALVTNWASGCTMVWNRSLCRLLQQAKLQSFLRWHDAWVHLVALSCGKVVADLNHSYIKRRITETNLIGERNFGAFSFARLYGHVKQLFTPSPHHYTSIANFLLENYGSDMCSKNRDIVQSFVSGQTSFIKRCHLAADCEYRIPFRNETLLIRLKLIANRY